MTNDMIKSIEDSLLALQKNAKEQIAKIVSIEEFSSKVYGLILETLIDIENYHVKKYNSDPENVLEHSCIEVNIASFEEDTYIFYLISIIKITNLPEGFKLEDVQSNFNSKYHKFIIECNNNHKLQNFKLSPIETSTFCNQLTMALNKNPAIDSHVTQLANSPTKLSIKLELEK